MKPKLIGKCAAAIVVLAIVVTMSLAYWTSTNDCEHYTPPRGDLMKAVKYCDYGPPDVLKVEEIEKPTPTDTQLLVKVRAASINAADGHMLRGQLLGRLIFGLRKPKVTRFGSDFSGVVEAVGKNVTQFKAGDDVFGARRGAVAEYVTVAAGGSVVAKPANVSFQQAAAVPIAAITALQGLRDSGKLQAGQKVLVNGASGGVGTFAVQIAKALGAQVTAVCSTRNLEMVRALGADHVVDYTKNNFTESNASYDVIYDLAGNYSFSERRRVLTPNGICVMTGIGGSGWDRDRWRNLAGELNSYVRSRFGKQKFVMFVAKLNREDLAILRDLMQKKKVKPVIDREYRLSETAEALRYLEEGHARGKVVINIE